MLNVVAAISVRPGHGAALVALIAEARPRVIENPACHRYDLQRQRRGEHEYVMLEAWESSAALREHGSSEAFARFAERLGEHVAAPPTVTVYEPVGDQVPLG